MYFFLAIPHNSSFWKTGVYERLWKKGDQEECYELNNFSLDRKNSEGKMFLWRNAPCEITQFMSKMYKRPIDTKW